jgi:hypothetical protein
MPPFIFWNKLPNYDCCRTLIQRSTTLKGLAGSYYPESSNPALALAKQFAKPVRRVANQVPPSYWNYDRLAFSSPHEAASAYVPPFPASRPSRPSYTPPHVSSFSQTLPLRLGRTATRSDDP